MSNGNGSAKLRDIAELLECSVATLSNAINGRCRMSAAMRQQVLDKCAGLNFLPNPPGRSLRLRRTDAVGVIYAPSFAELFGNVFYARIMEDLAETLSEAGLDLAGRKVPDDVSVVGFDDDPAAARASPAFNTVGLKKRDIGAVSARLVLDRLAGPDKPIVHQVQPTKLVVRESVAKR